MCSDSIHKLTDPKKKIPTITVAWDWDQWLLKVWKKIFKKKGGKIV